MTKAAMILAGLLTQSPAIEIATQSATSKAPASTRGFAKKVGTAWTSGLTGGDHQLPSKMRHHHIPRTSILGGVVSGRHGGDVYGASKKMCGGGDTWIGTRA